MSLDAVHVAGDPIDPIEPLELLALPDDTQLQVVLRSPTHTAYYSPAAHSLSLRPRPRMRMRMHPRLPATGALMRPAYPSLPSPAEARAAYGPYDLAPHMGMGIDAVEDHAHAHAQRICPTCRRLWPFAPDYVPAAAAAAGGPAAADHPGADQPGSQHPFAAAAAIAMSFQAPSTAPHYFRLLEAGPRVDGSSPASSAPEPWQALADGAGRISSLDDDGHSVPGTPAPSSPHRTGQRRNTGMGMGRSGSRSRCRGRGCGRGCGWDPDETPTTNNTIDASSTAPGYYQRFFTQIRKLGRGARGQVYLCQHVLNGNKLGVYAVKKMPCGDDQQVLVDSLKEVLLMETLQHPNIIHYQHAWIENAQASRFAPSVPTLFILMAAANGGSLEDWINTRSGRPAESGPSSPAASGLASRAERLKAAFRLQRRSQSQSQSQSQLPPHAQPYTEGSAASPAAATGRAVHLLREDEVMSLARDIVSGLGFLHSKGILHLDVKPANCLLHWSEDALTPSVLLSDFGSSALLHDNWRRRRSGHTGTMEYMAPEAVRVNARTGLLDELSAKADIWSFGMILHLLIFLRLPYSQVDDVDRLRDEMLAYDGWQDEAAYMLSNIHTCQSFIPLLSKLLQMDPGARPSADEILDSLRHLAHVRGLGPAGPSEFEFEFNQPFRSPALGHARKERLRRRRKHSLSTPHGPASIAGPRLLAADTAADADADADAGSADPQVGLDVDTDVDEPPSQPLWMAAALAAEHPLVRYQQERMGLAPASGPSGMISRGPGANANTSSLSLFSSTPSRAPRVRTTETLVAVLLLALAQKIAGDMYCFPSRIGRTWDYTLVLCATAACLITTTTTTTSSSSSTTASAATSAATATAGTAPTGGRQYNSRWQQWRVVAAVRLPSVLLLLLATVPLAVATASALAAGQGLNFNLDLGIGLGLGLGTGVGRTYRRGFGRAGSLPDVCAP